MLAVNTPSVNAMQQLYTVDNLSIRPHKLKQINTHHLTSLSLGLIHYRTLRTLLFLLHQQAGKSQQADLQVTVNSYQTSKLILICQPKPACQYKTDSQQTEIIIRPSTVSQPRLFHCQYITGGWRSPTKAQTLV